MTPTQRTLRHERELGRVAAVVEKWNPHVRIRQDLFGWIDVISVDPKGFGVIGIQTTTQQNAAARIEKARGKCSGALTAWLLAGNSLRLHSWAKRGPRGQRKMWTLSETEVAISNLRRR
jgi:hypothetical protein